MSEARLSIEAQNLNSNPSSPVKQSNGKMKTANGAKNRGPRTRQDQIRKLVKNNMLPISTAGAVIAAIILGIIIRACSDPWTARQLMYLEFPGEMFLRCLKLLTLPLIASSLVSAVGNLDLRLSGQIGKRALIYYMITTLIAISLGIFLVLTLHPGSVEKEKAMGDAPRLSRNITTPDTILDLIRNLIPSNIVEATFSQHATQLSAPMKNPNEKDLSKWTIKPGEVGGTNVMGIVTISIIIGAFIGALYRDGRTTLLTLFNDVSELTLRITGYVIWATPVGVAFLIMPRIIAVEDAGQMFRSVGFFTLTILIGLFIHGFLILPGIYYSFTRKNPYKFMAGMSEALLTAFGTASSTATLPASITCLEEKNMVNRNVVRFVVPIGATINMDGTALYEAVAAIFIAQSRDLEMTFVNVVIVSITATAASIGAAGIPQAGLITMVIVLNALGLPPEDISLVFIIDWLVDRFRTAINVLGDAYGSAVVEHLSQADLAAFGALEAAQKAPEEAEPGEIVLTVQSHQNTPTRRVNLENHVNPGFDEENEKL